MRAGSFGSHLRGAEHPRRSPGAPRIDPGESERASVVVLVGDGGGGVLGGGVCVEVEVELAMVRGFGELCVVRVRFHGSVDLGVGSGGVFFV